MAKRSKLDAGFDVDAAIATLHRVALMEGAVSQGDFRAKDPLQTAIAHAFLHGIGTDRCDRTPCRLGGICWALYELTTYRGEHGGPRGAVLRAAVESERFRGALRRDLEPYARSIAQLLKRGEEQHALEARSGVTKPMHSHEELCVEPRQLLTDVLRLIPRLDQSGAALRALLESSELRQPSSIKRSKLLLNAVYQHLKWGGMTYAEIARLVPDDLGRKGAADRVRKRVKGDDARSMHPAETTATNQSEESKVRDSSS